MEANNLVRNDQKKMFMVRNNASLKLGVLKLRKEILKIYRELGETTESIQAVNKLAKHYYNSLRNSGYYQQTHQSLISRAVASGEYWRFRIVDDHGVKITLHVMPQGAKIPLHAHPEKFSLTIVDQGLLSIKYDSWGRNHPVMTDTPAMILEASEACSGLPVKNNLHSIKAETPVTAFFSIRVDSRSGNNLIERFSMRNRYTIPGFFIAMLLPLFSMNTSALNSTDYSKRVLASEKEQIYQEQAIQLREKANYLRTLADDSSQVDAFHFYKQAALKGDAESKYWMGVMFLDGTGVTEDHYEALEWISRAANQHFAPAEKLLRHLLDNPAALDC